MNILFVVVLTITAEFVRSSVVPIIDQSRYAFNYAVNDPLTKDKKAQWEMRDGDTVKGSYSLVEPDGGVRVVDYKADALGFNAIVKKAVPNLHPVPLIPKIPAFSNVHLAPVSAPVVAPIATPVVEHSVAPFVEPVAPIVAPIAPIATSITAPIVPLIAPINYGFGAAPLTVGLPKAATLGHWSHPWDPLTHSFGGWVPISGPLLGGRYATVFSKKYVNGKVHRWATGPIPLPYGSTLVIKKKH